MRVSLGMFLIWILILIFAGAAFGVGGVVTVALIGAIVSFGPF